MTSLKPFVSDLNLSILSQNFPKHFQTFLLLAESLFQKFKITASLPVRPRHRRQIIPSFFWCFFVYHSLFLDFAFTLFFLRVIVLNIFSVLMSSTFLIIIVLCCIIFRSCAVQFYRLDTADTLAEYLPFGALLHTYYSILN